MRNRLSCEWSILHTCISNAREITRETTHLNRNRETRRSIDLLDDLSNLLHTPKQVRHFLGSQVTEPLRHPTGNHEHVCQSMASVLSTHNEGIWLYGLTAWDEWLEVYESR